MLRHESFLIDLSEWQDEDKKNPRVAVSELRTFLVGKGYSSLETEISKLLSKFSGFEVDSNTARTEKNPFSLRKTSNISVYTTCLKKEDCFAFLDMETRGNKLYAEFDLFLGGNTSVKDDLIENTMKCFGLTRTKEALLLSEPGDSLPKAIAERLKGDDPLSDALFQRLKEESERTILRELRKRGSILESDLKDLETKEVPTDRVKKTLDYLSGDEYKLVERKFAIVCRETSEIIFLLKSKKDIENAKSLECPKCSKQIGTEEVMYYYTSTDKLKLLLDGNRWMPLLIRDALIKAGVPRANILTEVKHGEDEIDLITFYKGRVFVIEAKNRPVSLNDAYKLSAKTSRLESIALKGHEQFGTGALAETSRIVYERLILEKLRGRAQGISGFIPIVISTHDVAKDAKDLLVETKSLARVLENCEGGLDSFVQEMIAEIDNEELQRRLESLVSRDSSDSVSNLAAFQVERGFERWYETNVGTAKPPVKATKAGTP